jgi:hypothetical protein
MSNNTNNTNNTTKKHILLVPFEDKDNAKLMGCKWDSLNKTWYFIGDYLPEELKKYKAYPVHVEYEDKDIFKSQYKSLRWNANKKNWLCNETDYRAITA